MNRARMVLKRLAIGFSGLVLFTAAGAGLGYGWLQSDGGRDWLVRQIEAAVSTPGETEVSIGRIDGDLLGSLSAHDLVLSDAAGPWLTVSMLEIDWRPWRLLGQTLDVEALSLTAIDIPRPPVRPEGIPDDSTGTGDLRDLVDFPLNVRIGRLAADKISLGPSVLGQTASFTLTGEAQGADSGPLSAALDLRRLDGPEMRVRADLRYDPKNDSLTAEVDAAEAPGGILPSLLGTPDLPGTELTLAGSGPLTAWDGDFAFSLGKVVQAQADIALRRTDNGDLGFLLKGHSEVQPVQQTAALDLITGRSEIIFDGSWQEARRLQLDRLAVTNDTFRLSTDGKIDMASDILDLALKVEAGESMALATLLGLDRLDQLSADILLSGTLNRPQAEIKLQTGGIGNPDFEAGTAEASGRLTAESDFLNEVPVVALALQGQLEALRLPGQDAVNQLLGPRLTWVLDAQVDTGSLSLDIDRLEATTEAATVSGSGQASAEAGTATLEVAVEVTELAALQPLTSISLGGAARLAGPLTVEDFGNRLAAELRGRWDRPSSDIALIAAAAGRGMGLTTRLTFDGSSLRIEEVTGRSNAADVTASLAITADAELRDARYSLRLPDAAVLAEALGIDTAGVATVEGQAAGPFDTLDVSGEAQLEGLTVEGQTLRQLAATYRLRIAGAEIDGPVTLALTSPLGPLEGRSELRLRDDSLTLANLAATLPETAINGELVVPLDGGDPVAALQVMFDDLGPWLSLAELSGGGRGKLDVRLNRSGEAAPVMVSAALSGVTLQPGEDAAAVSAESLTFKLQAQDLALAQPAGFAITADTLRWQGLDARRVDLDGKGTISDLEFRLSGAGDWIEPFELSAAGRVAQQAGTVTLALNQAAGRLFGEALTLRDTATLTLAPTETRLTGLDITSGKTRLTAEVRLGDRDIALAARLDALPLRRVDAFWESGVDGLVTAEVNLQGPLDDPTGTASLSARELHPRGSTDIPTLDLTAKADWRGGRVKLDGQLGGADVAAAGFSADAPLNLSAEGAIEVPPQAPLSGQIEWSGDITALLLFVPLPQHRLKGEAAMALKVSGTAGAPTVNGTVMLDQGRYENVETGTILNDITLRAEVADDRMTLASLTANDGAGGQVTGKGRLAIDPAQQFPFEIAVQLEKLNALRRDDVTAVASGSVEIDGTVEAPRVVARLTTETVEVSLLNNLPPNVVSLDVIEIKDGVVQTNPEQEDAAPAVDAALDIVIDMPRRVFVRGRGLDSEWAGRISVQGSAADPVVTGDLSIVRGRLDVIGKAFDLQAGRVVLPQSTSSEPTLDVTAVHKGQELEVTARLSGPLTKPELTLTSSPEVPRDEIISRILFNKSAASLTAAEAAQLAIALRDLTGNGGGTDILGFARRTLGVDVLRVETAGGGPALEAGKYLTDGVYVGVKQGASSQSSAAGVEVELTPNITVESEVTGSGASKSGVRFKWDY
ncbi:hypothetical protein HBA54_22665 [Pelagibius litoralis]|uniref:Translocation and assembly module TamB C-terminal domain-containing protein n=1 Tax=Pelagibius litoralis TaxID=374515 RepID=A0A967F1S1_9PROT|nr:translocation/assembly module TamB domain-containing protein [Pelagibius litoralis]NIA71402.1 hypothetical protein [Pelagibius litoralis]